MTDSVFQGFVEIIMRVHDEAHIARAQLLAKILSARVMNDFVRVADALLLELDPEGLTRRIKKDDRGDSDVELLDNPAQQALQAEVHGADSFDPTVPCEDLNATLSETSPINDHLKVVQGRPEHVSDLARR